MDDDCDYGVYKPFCERAEWADVTPLAQDDMERSVIRIAYTDRFREVHDYLRAVMRADERSHRVLKLTKEALELNPANYTTWHFRRVCLEALNVSLVPELDYVGCIILDNPKNYQVWYHRRWLTERLALDATSGMDGTQELQFTWEVFQDDAKNYHAWEHRQWAIRTFKLWDGELAATEALLEEDFRNNSAWNQRHFVVSNTTGWTDDVIARELGFVQRWIRVAVQNESAWNYLRGIYLNRDLAREAHLMAFCEELSAVSVESGDAPAAAAADADTSPHHLAFLVDVLAARLAARLAQVSDRQALSSTADCPEQKADVERAVLLCKRLAERVDTVRRHYWDYMARKLLLKYGVMTEASANVADSLSGANFVSCNI